MKFSPREGCIEGGGSSSSLIPYYFVSRCDCKKRQSVSNNVKRLSRVAEIFKKRNLRLLYCSSISLISDTMASGGSLYCTVGE